MANIHPFRALRYNFDHVGRDLSKLVAPPYDVLDQADKDRLLSGDEHNIVAIDLPHTPPKSAGPPSAYTKAADIMNKWLDEGVLCREPSPAIYVYHQEFTYEKKSYVRRKLIAALELEEFGRGSVFPHEETFGGPKEDRLALMKATQCHMSPVFGLFPDPAKQAASYFEDIVSKAPDATAEMNGVVNKLWIVTDGRTIGRVQAFMADKNIFIADGHHRYGTAMMYRDWLHETKGGSATDDAEENKVLMVFCAMEDPGSLILPTHRVLSGLDAEKLMALWSEGVSACDADRADMIIFDGPSGKRHPVKFTNRDILSKLEPDKSTHWRSLDVAYLHRYLVGELLGKSHADADVQVQYVKVAAQAMDTSRQVKGSALLMNGTPLDQLKGVSEAGELMPQKTTFFHPKLATGMVMHAMG